MKETKDVKETNNNKSNEKTEKKSKSTIGDIILRILILIAIFCTVAIGVGFYLQGLRDDIVTLKDSENQVNAIEESN